MARELREKVMTVLSTDQSNYEIARLAGMNPSIISRLRSQPEKMDRLSLLSAERIASVIEKPGKKD